MKYVYIRTTYADPLDLDKNFVGLWFRLFRFPELYVARCCPFPLP
jgi:hypothetical protein